MSERELIELVVDRLAVLGAEFTWQIEGGGYTTFTPETVVDLVLHPSKYLAL